MDTDKKPTERGLNAISLFVAVLLVAACCLGGAFAVALLSMMG